MNALSTRDLRAARRHIQMVFQDPQSSLNPRMTTRDIIGEPLIIHRLARGRVLDDRVVELMQDVGLDSHYLRRYPYAFSGGQRQRIGIARALALNPSLIVADEPTSALDVSVQAQILNLFQDLQQQHDLSYLFISHNLSVVEHISDRVAVMYLGTIVELAPTEELFSEPRHPYTEALLTAVPDPNPHHRVERVILEGDVPDPGAVRQGCAFGSEMQVSGRPVSAANTRVGAGAARCRAPCGVPLRRRSGAARSEQRRIAMNFGRWDSTMLDAAEEVQTFVDDLLIASVQDVKRSWHTPVAQAGAASDHGGPSLGARAVDRLLRVHHRTTRSRGWAVQMLVSEPAGSTGAGGTGRRPAAGQLQPARHPALRVQPRWADLGETGARRTSGRRQEEQYRTGGRRVRRRSRHDRGSGPTPSASGRTVSRHVAPPLERCFRSPSADPLRALPDGIHWRLYDEIPRFGRQGNRPGDVNLLFYDPEAREFVVNIRAHLGGQPGAVNLRQPRKGAGFLWSHQHTSRWP